MNRSRNVLLLLVLAAVGCGTSPSASQRLKFEEAERAFQAAKSADDYLLVAGTYQEIVDSGMSSATVFFNQGNAFMQAEQPGYAIASYRQALRFAPTDSSIHNNLQAALRKTGGSDPPDNWVRRVLFWQDWIGYASKFKLATGFLVLTSLCLIFARLLANRSLRTCGIVLLIGSVVTTASAVYDWYRFEHQVSGVVVTGQVIARKGNDTTYEPAFNAPLREGTEFRVLETRGDWSRVMVGDVGEGWLPSESVATY